MTVHTQPIFFIQRPYADKTDLSNRYTSKNLLTSNFTLAMSASVKIDVNKILF
jgi:hypothetical protein